MPLPFGYDSQEQLDAAFEARARARGGQKAVDRVKAQREAKRAAPKSMPSVEGYAAKMGQHMQGRKVWILVEPEVG